MDEKHKQKQERRCHVSCLILHVVSVINHETCEALKEVGDFSVIMGKLYFPTETQVGDVSRMDEDPERHNISYCVALGCKYSN